MTAQILLTKVIDDDDKLSSPSYSFGAIRNESTKWKIHSNKYIIGLSYFLLLSSYYTYVVLLLLTTVAIL